VAECTQPRPGYPPAKKSIFSEGTPAESLASLSREELERQLALFRQKAIELDVLRLRDASLATVSRGSRNSEPQTLLQAFMRVRERYDSVNSSVLLLDDLDPGNICLSRTGLTMGSRILHRQPWCAEET